MSPSLNPSEPQIAVHLALVDKSFRNGEQVTPVLRQVEFEARTGEQSEVVTKAWVR